ncbi:MAG: asparagine synthase (glutamine-hydrolyzing) [Deltaproteobacteria bacterium]|nr:asparagine synthase (glutamine-hydrolyzing) [Deltaproteobacteria bacterium]
MCGICGLVRSDRGRSVDPTVVDAMASTLRLRGPDDSGVHVDGNAALGFRRLSIIDLSTGHQPLSNEDGTLWIAFNGEIYNFAELRVDLLSRGHVFRTATDTEAILHLYEEVGPAVVDRLRGMFAFAIWDGRTRTLFCARDRFGKKPFYYFHDQGQFAFGSELKAVLAAPGVPREIDPEALDSYFSWGYVAGERSIYRGIRKLPAAHTLTLRTDPWCEPAVRRYWDIRLAPEEGRSDRDWQEELEHELSEAVRLRLVSDVPLGAFLSGGIDSGTVVALMARHSSRPVKTFTIGFQNPAYNEVERARLVARKYGTDHHEEIVEPQSLDLLDALVDAFDEPFADSSAIPTFIVSRFARRHVTVALSGDGGDELFAGYQSYRKLHRLVQRNPVPEWLRPLTFGALEAVWPIWAAGKGLLYYLSQDRQGLLSAFEVFPGRERKALYAHDLWAQLRRGPGRAERRMLAAASRGDCIVSQAQELDMRTYLVDDILTKVDRTSMACSLEVRAPILDHKVAELTFRMPTRLKFSPEGGKLIFRKTFGPLLTPEHLAGPKQGFAVPVMDWFRKERRSWMSDVLLDPGNPMSEYVRPAFVARLIRSHDLGQRDFSFKLWTLLFFSAWLGRAKPERGIAVRQPIAPGGRGSSTA